MCDSSTAWDKPPISVVQLSQQEDWSGVGVSEIEHEAGLEQLLRTGFLSLGSRRKLGSMPGWQAEPSTVPLAGVDMPTYLWDRPHNRKSLECWNTAQVLNKAQARGCTHLCPVCRRSCSVGTSIQHRRCSCTWAGRRTGAGIKKIKMSRKTFENLTKSPTVYPLMFISIRKLSGFSFSSQWLSI